MIGRTFSHYKIVAPLGVGGTGTVYQGEDVRDGRSVALKFPHRALIQTEGARSRWLSSASIALELDHPNIVAAYEVCDANDEVFIAMELIGRRTLRSRIEAGPVPLRESLSVARSVTEALVHAHARGFVHGDIKPENVLLGPDGQVKVADFGTGIDPSDVELIDLVRDFTPGYVAPETLRGERAGPSADLYGIGVLLYEMISGGQPFGGENIATASQRVLNEAPPPLPPAAPIALQQLIESLLAKTSADRPGSAAVVAARLVELGAA